MDEKRLIDANALINAIPGISKDMKRPGAVELACLLMIAEAPTVDAVLVVRCKDCKYTRKKNGHEQFMYNENVCICTKEDIWGINKSELVWSDGFCSYGERKDNG